MLPEKSVEQRHQRRELGFEALAVDEVGLAGHREEFVDRLRAVGVQPGRFAAEALGDDDLLAEGLVARPASPRARRLGARLVSSAQRRAAVGAPSRMSILWMNSWITTL